MPERLALSRTLWLIVAPPAAGFVWQLASGLARRRRPAGADARDAVARVARVASASDRRCSRRGATLGQCAALRARAAGTGALVETPPWGRVAAADRASGLGLRFDPLSGTACGLACAVAAGAPRCSSLRDRPRSGAAARGRGSSSRLAGGLARVSRRRLRRDGSWGGRWRPPRPRGSPAGRDPRAGAVRATRGALAIARAARRRASFAADAGGLDGLRHELAPRAPFVVAAAAMERVGASGRRADGSLGRRQLRAGRSALLGPFLLLRLDVARAVSRRRAAPVVAAAGIAMLVPAIGGRVLARAGRGVALARARGRRACGAHCVALAADGATRRRGSSSVAAGLSRRSCCSRRPRAGSPAAGVAAPRRGPTDLEARAARERRAGAPGILAPELRALGRRRHRGGGRGDRARVGLGPRRESTPGDRRARVPFAAGSWLLLVAVLAWLSCSYWSAAPAWAGVGAARSGRIVLTPCRTAGEGRSSSHRARQDKAMVRRAAGHERRGASRSPSPASPSAATRTTSARPLARPVRFVGGRRDDRDPRARRLEGRRRVLDAREEPRVRQAFGHVVVTSTDEQAGEVAMGFRAQLPTGLGWVGEHALSLLVALAAGRRRSSPRVAPRRAPRRSASSAAPPSAPRVVELLLARVGLPALRARRRARRRQRRVPARRARRLGAVARRRVVPRRRRREHRCSSSSRPRWASWRCWSHGERRRTDAYYAALALLASGDRWRRSSRSTWRSSSRRGRRVLVALVAPRRRVGRSARAPRRRASSASSAASGRSRCSSRSPRSRAHRAARSSSTGRRSRTRCRSRSSPVRRSRPGRRSSASRSSTPTWGLLFVAVAAATPARSASRLAARRARGRARRARRSSSAASSSALGPYLLMRVGLGALPEGARWAGPSIAAVGAHRRRVGRPVRDGAARPAALRRLRVVANAGLCLYGIGALTPQGIAGAVMALFAHGLAAALLLGVANALERRARTCDAVRLAGPRRRGARRWPRCSPWRSRSRSALPALVGSWGLLLALRGRIRAAPAARA